MIHVQPSATAHAVCEPEFSDHEKSLRMQLMERSEKAEGSLTSSLERGQLSQMESNRLYHLALALGHASCAHVLAKSGASSSACFPISLSAPPEPSFARRRQRATAAARERVVNGRHVLMMELWPCEDAALRCVPDILSKCLTVEQVSKEEMALDLLFATKVNRKDCCEVLLSQGAPVDAVDNGYLNTPLMYASMSLVCPLVSLFLSYGADPNAANSQGDTSLHKVISKPARTKEAESAMERCAQLLIEHKAKIEVRNKHNETPLMKLARRNLCNSSGIASVLVKAAKDKRSGMLLEDKGRNRTSMHEAARLGNALLLRMILQAQIFDINAKDKEGNTALHVAGDMQGVPPRVPIAAVRPRLECVKLLLEAKADVHALNDKGDTVLHTNVGRCTGPFLEYLIEQGAALGVKNPQGNTALDVALSRQALSATVMLLMRGEKKDRALALASRSSEDADVPHRKTTTRKATMKKTTLLHLAAKSQQWAEKCNLLLDEGGLASEVNVQDEKGNTALSLAIAHGNIEAVPLLLASGADPLIENDSGASALQIAKRVHCVTSIANIVNSNGKLLDDPEFVRQLKDNADEEGHTLLHRSVLCRDKGSLEFCVSTLGMDVNAKCKGKRDEYSTGGTPLHLAAERGYTCMISLLVELKADVNNPGGEYSGNTPAHLAVAQDYKETLELLLRLGADPTKANDNGMDLEEVARLYAAQECLEVLCG